MRIIKAVFSFPVIGFLALVFSIYLIFGLCVGWVSDSLDRL